MIHRTPLSPCLYDWHKCRTIRETHFSFLSKPEEHDRTDNFIFTKNLIKFCSDKWSKGYLKWIKFPFKVKRNANIFLRSDVACVRADGYQVWGFPADLFTIFLTLNWCRNNMLYGSRIFRHGTFCRWTVPRKKKPNRT